MADKTTSDPEQLLDALHQRSEQLSNILRSINSGVAVVDGRGSVVMLNDAARNLVGLTYSPELTLGDFAAQFEWRDGTGQKFTADSFPVTHLLTTSEPFDDVKMSRGEGENTMHFRLSGTPLTGRDGSQIGAVVVFHDVTTMVNLQIELERVNEQRLGFYSGMSHELRTPLQGIIGYTELLLEESEDETFEHESLTAIRSSCDHLLSLVNDLLDISKIIAGRMELRKKDTDVSNIVSDSVAMLAGRAREKGLTLTINFADLGVHSVDERALRQVVLNLISNAIKFTNQGGEVVVSTELTDDGIHILVRDTGIGMSKEDQKVIFREFVQVKGPDGTVRPGTGLGLALSKHFVDMHGGSLVVLSEVGVGSTFIVNIPTGE